MRNISLNAYFSCTPFEYMVLCTITANCVCLAMEVHLPNNDRRQLSTRMVSRQRFDDVDLRYCANIYRMTSKGVALFTI